MAKLDEDGFEKELKGTIKERKKANRSMSKEEINWERELFQQAQQQRFDDNLIKLNAEHANRRKNLDKDQKDQIESLLAYFETVEQDLLGPSSAGSSAAETATAEVATEN